MAHALSPKYGAISVIDTADMSVLATVWGNEESPLCGSDTVTVDGKRGMVLLGQADGVITLDAQSLAVRDVARVSRGRWAGCLAIDPLQGTAYVAEDRRRLWSWQPVVGRERVRP